MKKGIKYIRNFLLVDVTEYAKEYPAIDSAIDSGLPIFLFFILKLNILSWNILLGFSITNSLHNFCI